MKISTKGRYALRLMIDIAQHDQNSFVALKEVSKRQDISLKYLEQIVSPLARGGFLQSARGPHGGYRLARQPQEYLVGDILRTIEGSLTPVTCTEPNGEQCGRHDYCSAVRFWEGLDVQIEKYVDSYTLQDFI